MNNDEQINKLETGCKSGCSKFIFSGVKNKSILTLTLCN